MHSYTVTQDAINKAKVGDAVCIISGREYQYVNLHTITKITPTGQIKVATHGEAVLTFKVATYCGALQLRAASAHSYMCDAYLVLDLERVAAEKAAKVVRQNAAAALSALSEPFSGSRPRSTWSKEVMLEAVVRLEALVAAARSAVEAL